MLGWTKRLLPIMKIIGPIRVDIPRRISCAGTCAIVPPPPSQTSFQPSCTMSHTHSHAPGQPTHSHGPPPPTPQQQQQQVKQVLPPPDPVMQAVIEASFVPVDVALGPPENAAALCQAHSLEKCSECDVDYSSLNRISKLLLMNPNLRCPPPAQMVTQKLSQAVTAMKEEGNVSASQNRCTFVY